ncbi:hypothetical protein M9H77_03860 [Catharanthus roseus]|uniref:Uncharacterized protein n=1 Tax=Catharanthus roseus TaxID=4058 RepID=A0ACC0CCQ1_CATRO|nr:hypothetical protein M9H77_03860 [Catharanthus roseus]
MSLIPVFHRGRRPISYYNTFSSHDRISWDPSTHHHQYHFNTPLIGPPHPHSYYPPNYSNNYHHRHHHANHHESLGGAGGVEWKEGPEAYFIKTQLPTGMRKEDVRVVVDEDSKMLKISGYRGIEFEDRHDNWQHVQRSSRKFLTSFMLPQDAISHQIRSSMENGVFTVTVPKRKEKNHVRPVPIVF